MTKRKAKRGKRFYGWYIAGALAVTETMSYGIVFYAFSVFIKPMETDLGWSRAELSGGFSLALLVMAALAYPVGAWVDRHGARLLMTLGSLAAALLVLAWSQVQSLSAFYLIWAGLGVCGAAIFYEPAFAVIATWFERRRGVALSIVTFAAGFASTIFLPLSNALLEAFGWRDAVLLLALLLGAVTVPLHALVLRRRPSDLGWQPDGEARPTPRQEGESAAPAPRKPAGTTLQGALRTRFFWLFTLAFALAVLSGSAVRVHFIPFLIDRGIDPAQAALAAGSIGIMQVVGRVLFAPLDSRLPGTLLMSIIFGLHMLALLVLMGGTAFVLVIPFVAFFGASAGMRTLVRPALLAERFGISHYGRIASINSIFLTLAATVAPFVAGLLYDAAGNYDALLGIVAVLAGAALLVTFFVRSDAAAPMPEAA